MAQGWGIAALVIFLPLGFYLFFKMMTAKTRKAHWGYFTLAMCLGTILIGILGASGLMPSAEQMQQHEAPSPEAAFAKLPTPALVTIALVAVIWMGGGNWVMISARRRAGRSWCDSLNPFNPPFRDMDRKAWLQLAFLAVASFVVLSIGMEFVAGVGSGGDGTPPAS